MNLFDKILTTQELLESPPVLIDIGASGKLHKLWRRISKNSICIAFDADERKFDYVKEETNKFKKLLIYNCIVTDSDIGESDFYFTKSPYCSSLLQPDQESLKDWIFSDLFNIEKKVKMKTKSLCSVLSEAEVDYIDWFKTDSQGIDLRLFKSLPENIRNKILVAEFEPGILDAYHGEDKLFSLMDYMDNKNFWMSDIDIRGTVRLPAERMKALFNNKIIKKLIQLSIKKSPGWAEVRYINTFKDKFNKREYLLGWIFATINKQHGFALTLADEGYLNFNDQIFIIMKNHSIRKIKIDFLKLGFFPEMINHVKSIFTR